MSGGFNVFPREIEDVLTSAPERVGGGRHRGARREVGRGRHRARRRPAGRHAATSTRCASWSANARARSTHPKTIEIVDSLPLTAVGKADKKVLRARYWGDRSRGVRLTARAPSAGGPGPGARRGGRAAARPPAWPGTPAGCRRRRRPASACARVAPVGTSRSRPSSPTMLPGPSTASSTPRVVLDDHLAVGDHRELPGRGAALDQHRRPGGQPDRPSAASGSAPARGGRTRRTAPGRRRRG